jgi:hypothetical protein
MDTNVETPLLHDAAVATVDENSAELWVLLNAAKLRIAVDQSLKQPSSLDAKRALAFLKHFTGYRKWVSERNRAVFECFVDRTADRQLVGDEVLRKVEEIEEMAIAQSQSHSRRRALVASRGRS